MSEPADPRRLRPWYLLVAAGVLWITGLVGASATWAELSHLRGSERTRSELDRNLAEASHPLFRIELERQRARLESLGHHHERAFPIGVARLLLEALLVWSAGAVVVGRRSGRSLMLQALLGNAALVVIGYLLLAPVRYETAEAVGQRAVEMAELGPLEGHDKKASRSFYTQQQHVNDIVRTGAEVGFYLLAAVILTRRRARAYFAAVEDAAVSDSSAGG